ncbi:hypothetical protein ABT373_17825 [Streptomyces sp. NPDC000070]|uniref:hypothetical protein n=1 Tax=Streptomyces sp. NPDC000070 TaxID=3154240 RepID=UPI003324A978
MVVHSRLFDISRALATVQVCCKLGLWFRDAIDGRRTVAEFVPPSDPGTTGGITDPAELAELRMPSSTARALRRERRRARRQWPGRTPPDRQCGCRQANCSHVQSS